MKRSFLIGFSILIITWVVSLHPNLLPAGLSPTAWRMAGLTAMVAIFWLTQTLSIGATSLIPLFALPLMGIMPASKVAPAYGSNVILLFMTGFFIAKTIERWQLPMRISLQIIKLIGTGPKRLILGFMSSTAVLSMWLSNTACCLMMLPLAVAAIDQFKLIEADKNQVKNFATCLMLGIAYAANIGGLGTPIASSSNIIFLANFKEFFPELPSISFLQWILIAIPLVIVFLSLTWFYLVNGSAVKITAPAEQLEDNETVLWEEPTNTLDTGGVATAVRNQPKSAEMIDAQLQKLGKMSAAEKYVAVLFAVTAMLWLFLGDLTIGSFTIPGWSSYLGLENEVKNTTVAAAIAFIMFAIPVETKEGEKTHLLDWETAKKIPWDILLLFGAGVAISKGFSASGLSQFLTDILAVVLGKMPLFTTIIIVCIFTAIVTEFASNTAISRLMMPICASLAPALGLSPLLLMLTATKSLKCTFCLPVATPPNAIVYSQKYFDIATMTRVGLVLNVMGIILIALTINFLAVPILNQ